MPRRYRVQKRADSAAATRQRLVEATYALHHEQGIAETTMKQIAARAGVGIGTVYNHFPTYADAVRACGAHVFHLTPPPTADIFAGVTGVAARVRTLASALFAFYCRCPGIGLARRDQDKIAVLDDHMTRLDGVVSALVREALGRAGRRAVAIASALLDFDSHKQFVRQGLSTERAAAAAAGLILMWLAAQKPDAISRGRHPIGKG
jgi:AcrR family transcriptional regulator